MLTISAYLIASLPRNSRTAALNLGSPTAVMCPRPESVIRFDDLMACGSEAEALKKGLLRTEGKQYVVQDGDILNILFNV